MTTKQIAGSEQDFQLVTRIHAAGSQEGIGRVLGRRAEAAYGWQPRPIDPELGRARHEWFAEHWPQHHARLRGLAGGRLRDDLEYDGLSGLPQGCSALWVPPSASTDGHGRIGRTYDFFPWTTSEIMHETFPLPGELPMASRPHVITTVPDDGLASTVVSMSDLDGCMDGVNEAGLAVALLIQDFAGAEPPEETGAQVGVNSVQLPRFLLDTCESAAEAKRALAGLRHYDFGMPLHYIVADAAGEAFVWEGGRAFETGGGPLCVTNHPLHEHPDPLALPPDSARTFGSFGRLRSLYEASRGGPMSPEELRASLAEVSCGQDQVLRTLWTTVFDTTERTMAVRFYLGDGEKEPRYSEELLFTCGV
ncbi:C45 family autoproteolytic acyltransferase/hydrolase [Nonomuraea sp. NPDC050328]|uniref:C45 family autoproteolytic acyltransferase/hydolase n=1 Tax=Nonomuraea sp. NPDC050328 TaxID=3364361 RepID=UPI0037A11A65